MPFGPAATVPWTLGPGSRQTDNQQTRKPARQRANRPRNQQTNKPTKQQTNTTTSKKSRDEPPNQPKNNQSINQKSTKMAPKSVLQAVLGASWGFLGALGPILAPRRPQELKTHRNHHSSTPPGEPRWDQKFIKNWSGGLPKSDHFFDWLWGRVLLPFGPNLAPTWPPKPSPNRPKLAPRSIKNWIKMPTNFLFDF